MFHLQVKLYLFCNTQVLQPFLKYESWRGLFILSSCPAITFYWPNLAFSYTPSCQYGWQNLKGTLSSAGVNQSRIWRQWAYMCSWNIHTTFRSFAAFDNSEAAWLLEARVSFLNLKKHLLPTCKLKKIHLELLRYDEHGCYNTIFGQFSEWSHALSISPWLCIQHNSAAA